MTIGPSRLLVTGGGGGGEGQVLSSLVPQTTVQPPRTCTGQGWDNEGGVQTDTKGNRARARPLPPGLRHLTTAGRSSAAPPPAPGPQAPVPGSCQGRSGPR